VFLDAGGLTLGFALHLVVVTVVHVAVHGDAMLQH